MSAINSLVVGQFQERLTRIGSRKIVGSCFGKVVEIIRFVVSGINTHLPS